MSDLIANGVVAGCLTAAFFLSVSIIWMLLSLVIDAFINTSNRTRVKWLTWTVVVSAIYAVMWFVAHNILLANIPKE